MRIPNALLLLLPLTASIWLLPAAPAEATPKIDLVTMGPGDHPFEVFGHAALCVHSRQHPEGACYNYGTADFEHPVALGWGVLRGEAQFWVQRVSWERVRRLYTEADRTIYSQRLPLTEAQAWGLARALEEDVKPENKAYRYDHFFDNCTTRVRDRIDLAVGGALREDTASPYPASFRRLVRRGFADAPELLILSEFALGRMLDQRPSLWEALFLPRILRDHVQARLGVEPRLIHTRQGPPVPTDPGGPLQARLLGLLLLGVALGGLGALGERRGARWPFVITGALLGTMGLVVWALALLSSTTELRYNEVLLLLVPLDYALIGFGARSRRLYLIARLAIVALTLAASLVGLLVQPLAPVAAMLLLALLPSVILATRAAKNAPSPPNRSSTASI